MSEAETKAPTPGPTLADADDQRLESLRIDKWLWAARLFKTRSLASDACSAGHVRLDGQSVKASKTIRRGARIEALTPGGPKEVEVLGLRAKRGPAPLARQLYADHTPPPPEKGPSVPVQRERGTGRPSKRDRRLIDKLRGY